MIEEAKKDLKDCQEIIDILFGKFKVKGKISVPVGINLRTFDNNVNEEYFDFLDKLNIDVVKKGCDVNIFLSDKNIEKVFHLIKTF